MGLPAPKSCAEIFKSGSEYVNLRTSKSTSVTVSFFFSSFFFFFFFFFGGGGGGNARILRDLVSPPFPYEMWLSWSWWWLEIILMVHAGLDEEQVSKTIRGREVSCKKQSPTLALLQAFHSAERSALACDTWSKTPSWKVDKLGRCNTGCSCGTPVGSGSAGTSCGSGGAGGANGGWDHYWRAWGNTPGGKKSEMGTLTLSQHLPSNHQHGALPLTLTSGETSPLSCHCTIP